MGDIGRNFVEIRDDLRSRHEAYIGRFGVSSNRHIGIDNLMLSRILAKIKLVAKALHDSGAIDIVEELDVRSNDGDFLMSLRIGKKGSPHGVYLLNNGSGVVVAGSVGLASGVGTMSGKLALATDDSKICRQFRDVLSDDFDWKELADFCLDSVHEVIYSRHEVMMESVFEDKTP